MHSSSPRRPEGFSAGMPDVGFGIAKQDLKPAVSRHRDNLEAQSDAILKKYGVSSYEELKALGDADLDVIEINDVRRLLELSSEIAKIVENPENKTAIKEVEVSIEGYSMVGSPRDIGGKMAFWAKDRESHYVVVSEDGRVFGQDEGWSHVGEPQDIGGKIAFSVEPEGGKKRFIATEDGREIGKEKGYFSMGMPRDIGGEIAFVANKFRQSSVIVKEDGTEIELHKGFKRVGTIIGVGGEIVYSVQTKEGKWIVVTEDGKEIGGEYDKASQPTNINEKLVFVAYLDGEGLVVSEDGFEIGKGEGFSSIGSIHDIGGKIAFRAVKDRYQVLVTENGDKITYMKEASHMKEPQCLGEVIVYWAEEYGADYITTEDDQEICSPRDYDEIYNIVLVDSSHVAITGKVGKKYVRKIHEIPASLEE